MKFNVKRHAVVQPQDQSIRIIPLTRGYEAIVDAECYDWLMQWNWCALSADGGRIYASRSPDQKLMHRVLVPGVHEVVDHDNGNELDNRNSNLFPRTNSENILKSKLYSTNKSGIRGVYWSESRKRWIAARKGRRIGGFSTKELAAEAYKNASEE